MRLHCLQPAVAPGVDYVAEYVTTCLVGSEAAARLLQACRKHCRPLMQLLRLRRGTAWCASHLRRTRRRRSRSSTAPSWKDARSQSDWTSAMRVPGLSTLPLLARWPAVARLDACLPRKTMSVVMRACAGSQRAARAQVCIVEQLRARRGRQGGQLRAAAGRPALGLCGCAAALGGAGGHSEVDSAHGETTASGSLERRLSLTWRTRVALNDRLTLDRPPLACLNAWPFLPFKH